MSVVIHAVTCSDVIHGEMGVGVKHGVNSSHSVESKSQGTRVGELARAAGLGLG